ncbi:MAG: hypothetical protein N2235_08775 [Fischerella sp.]|nr:hypothetical protein [Fischerella sp.]
MLAPIFTEVNTAAAASISPSGKAAERELKAEAIGEEKVLRSCLLLAQTGFRDPTKS